MTPGEAHELKRRNFIEQARACFEFLVTELGYAPPDLQSHAQPNGTVIRDDLRYVNEARQRVVEVSNAYHPVDYGFEINCLRLPHKSPLGDHSPDRLLCLYVNKEQQDMEQTYVRDKARELRGRYFGVIAGSEWVEP